MELIEEKDLRHTQYMSTSRFLPDKITTPRYDNLFTHNKDMSLTSIGDTLTVYCGPIVSDIGDVGSVTADFCLNG